MSWADPRTNKSKKKQRCYLGPCVDVEQKQKRRSQLWHLFGGQEKEEKEHPKDKSGLDASAKLTRAELNKRSGDADLSKDKSGPESPPESGEVGMSKDISGPEY
ncbi:hypothetical protein Tco_0271359 [Tanacetum coccineum]